jgi:hypothetical protein
MSHGHWGRVLETAEGVLIANMAMQWANRRRPIRYREPSRREREEERIQYAKDVARQAGDAAAEAVREESRAVASARAVEEMQRKADARETFRLRFAALAPKTSSLADMIATEATIDERKRLIQEYRKTRFVSDGDMHRMDNYIREPSVFDTTTLPSAYVFTSQAEYDRKCANAAQCKAERLAIQADALAGKPRPVHTVPTPAWWWRWGLVGINRSAPVRLPHRIEPRF